MTTYRNIHWKKRDYECTNVIACVSDNPPNENWAECDETILNGLTPLWIERNVRYYGYL